MNHDTYLALRDSAAAFPLPGRGHIEATGEDRARLLHAMTTNHVAGLVPGESCYVFFLSSQGRILADANIICTPSSLLIDTEPESAAAIYTHLDKFIIADDVSLSDLTSQTATLALEGPQSPEVLARLGIEVPLAPGQWFAWRTWVVAALTASGGRGFRFFVPAAERDNVLALLTGAGAPLATAEEWNVVRIENGVARYGQDITEREIPQETGLVPRAVSFTKGCYLGQEIVERVRSRGHVNRQLMRLSIDGVEVPAARAKILAEEKEVGEITSAAYSPAEGKALALGYVRTQAAAAGALTLAGGRAVTIIAPR